MIPHIETFNDFVAFLATRGGKPDDQWTYKSGQLALIDTVRYELTLYKNPGRDRVPGLVFKFHVSSRDLELHTKINTLLERLKPYQWSQQ